MVMHARKISRLNDGYYERGQAHPFEDNKSTRGSSSSRHYNDRNPDKGRTSPSYRYRDRDDSPPRSNPRYANKSYHDKTKSRTEREKHSGGASTSVGRRVEGTRTNNSGHNHKEPPKDATKDSKKRDEVQKSAVRTCGDWSEHISSIGKKYYYNCKTEVSKWEKPREWKDSEAVECNSKPHVKSKNRDGRVGSGSKGITDDRNRHSTMDRTNDRQAHNKFVSSSFGSPAPSRDRHGNTQNSASHNTMSVIGGGSSRTFSTPPSRQTPCSAGNSLPQSSHDRDKQRTQQLSHPKVWQSQQDKNDHLSHLQSSRESSSGPPLDRSLSHDGYGPMGYNDRRRDCGNSSNLLSLPSSSGYHHINTPTHTTNNSAGFNGAKPIHHSNQDEGQVDMDISPGSTPTEESRLEKSLPSLVLSTTTPTTPTACNPHTVTSTPPMAINSGGTTPRMSTANTPNLSTVLPQVLQQLGIETLTQLNSISDNKSFSVTQAIQTLQKLQQVLIVQQQQQQQRKLQQIVQQLQAQLAHQQQQPQAHPNQLKDGSQSPYSPPDESDGTPLQSPEYVPNSTGHSHNNDEEASNSRSRESPRRSSPTPSHGSSQSAAVAALSATHRKQETFQLTPSLANYYKDSLVDHVSGWQADLYERQASHYSEEAHTVGSLHCSQVSVELKRARSLVRVGEIQATLQEQRILFIRQQIKDLDNWRTQNTFMPSTTLPSSMSHKDT